jgi:hypothetical protein
MFPRTMTTDGFVDPLGLAQRRLSPTVVIGSVDVTNALRGGTVHMGMDSRGEVKLTLDPAALPPEPVDYLATMTYSSSGSGVRADFAGHVRRAADDDGRIRVDAFGATLLTENAAGLLISRGVGPPQLFYVMARSAGMTDDELVIQDLDAAEPEIFEVIVPLHGVALERRHRVAGVTLLRGKDVMPRLVDMDFGDDIEAMTADVCAMALHSDRRPYVAEQAGLREIDTAIDWLAARFQHGLALSSSGAIQPFDRASARARPRRGDLVVVRGLRSGQRWLRSVAYEGMRFSATIAVDDPLLDIEPTSLRLTDRLALAACRRATSAVEPLARVQALSEAIESLVSGVSIPRRWERAVLKEIKNSLSSELPADLLEAAKQAIGNLNQPGLMQRFRALVDEEGLPVSDSELDLLDQVRAVRNDAVHGRTATAPSPADLDYATAIICRVVVQHLLRAKS